MTTHDLSSRSSSHPSLNTTLQHDWETSTPQHEPRTPKIEKKSADKGVLVSEGGHSKALEAGLADSIIVSWDGPEDPMNPQNWSYKKKWAATSVVSAYTFISPIASSMVAPAAEAVGRDFEITNDVVLSMTVSIFILAYAFGPLFLGPLSEIFGRARVLQSANMFFLVFNIACGFSNTTTQLIVFRFLAGFGGSAPLAIGGGVLGDLWAPEERGQAVAIYSLAPLLGPVIGPVAGAWIAEKSTWRWVFWSTSICCGVIQTFGLVFLRETFPPVLLEQKAKRIRKDMGLGPHDQHHVRTQYESPDRHWQQIFAKALFRPFVMFVQEPIVQLLGAYMAFLWQALFSESSVDAWKKLTTAAPGRRAGLIYLILVTTPAIYQGLYGQPVGLAGLHYIALGIGLSGASQINARLLDRVYKYLKEKNGDNGKPEYRLPSLFPGSVLLPIGLLIFGWTAQERVFWIVPDIGILLIGAGMILVFQGVQTYVIDAFTLHAASALAAVSFLRSLAGFGFPLFAPAMYKALGYGKGDTILAALAIGIGCPAPFLFWHYGERIRNRSRHARNESL